MSTCLVSNVWRLTRQSIGGARTYVIKEGNRNTRAATVPPTKLCNKKIAPKNELAKFMAGQYMIVKKEVSKH
jgi:hypothetical protein